LHQRLFRGVTRPCDKPKAVFRYAGPRLQDAGTPLFLLLQIFYSTIQCNCTTYNVPPGAGLQKRANFSTLILGLAGTGDQTRATCVARSGDNRLTTRTLYRSKTKLCMFQFNSRKYVGKKERLKEIQLKFNS
jgi:hypothetical protein